MRKWWRHTETFQNLARDIFLNKILMNISKYLGSNHKTYHTDTDRKLRLHEIVKSLLKEKKYS